MECPNCGMTLEVEDIFDTDRSGDYMIEKVSGSCLECGKDYTWRRRYMMVFKDEYECCDT